MGKFIKQKCWHDASVVGDYVCAEEQLDTGSAVQYGVYESVVNFSTYRGTDWYLVTGHVGDDRRGYVFNQC